MLYDLYCSTNALRSVLLNKYFSADKIKKMRWAGHVARIGDRRVPYRVLVGIPEGKRAHVRRKHRWENNSKVDLREVGRGDMDWIGFGQDRGRWRDVVNTVMNFPVP